MNTSPSGPIQIPDADWDCLREALELYVMAAIGAWGDPSFAVVAAPPFGRDQWTLATKPLNEPPAQLLPNIGKPIRGATGTKVDLTKADEILNIRNALRATAGGYLGHETAFADKVREAESFLRYAVGRSKPLLQAIRLHAYGPDGAEKLEELDGAPNPVFPPYMLEAAQVESLVAATLDRRGLDVAALRELQLADASAIAEDTVKALRAALNVAYFKFVVIALLNGPPIDHEEWVAIAGSWYDRPFRVILGYPDDTLCGRLMSRVGHDNALFIPDHLGTLNCYVRLEYELPATISSGEMSGANSAAGEYVRRAVDVLRLLHSDDIGIVYLAGMSADEELHDHRALSPPFSEYFPERPNLMYRTPMRRIFDPPSGEPLTQEKLEQFAHLFDTWGLKDISIAGLPTAMERLRGIYDRYAPEDVARLVDAVTALEALYLPDTKGELGFRLVTRAAWFLAPQAEDISVRVRLARDITDIYEARSSLVHTGKISRKLKTRDRELANRAIRLLRASLLQFLETQFGRDLATKKLVEQWLLITMGQSTLKAVDLPASSVAPEADTSGEAAPPASSRAPTAGSQESR